MHGVIVEPNSSNHRGCSCIIWVMKTDILITHYTTHRCGTTISSEHYLHEQIKKYMVWLEDIFLKPIPIEAVRSPKPWVLGNGTEAAK